MFSNLFKRAEASVDNAIGDLGNRVLIALPFLVAFGFAAASLSSILNRTYGAEEGNLILAGGFCLLGFVIALIVKMRRHPSIAEAVNGPAEELQEEESRPGQSLFADEALMAIVTSAAPVVLPALLKTGMKNWHLLLAAAAGVYVFSRSEAGARPQPGE